MASLIATSVLAFLISFVHGGPIVGRQDDGDGVSVNGWSTTTAVQSSEPPVSVIGLSSIRSADREIVTLTTTEWTVVTPTTTLERIVSIFPVTRTETDGRIDVSVATITVVNSPASTVLSETSPASVQGGGGNNNRGAIAGGVVGAVVVAVIALLIMLRFRNKQSKAHWRNRNLEGMNRRWQFLDRKAPMPPASAEAPTYADRPYDGTNPRTPSSPSTPNPVPLLIRETRRPSPVDVAQPSPGHHRRQSSFGGSTHRRAESIEMATK